MYDYICEDFAPPTAIRRIKMFTKYYSANFKFGHQFYTELSHCETLEETRQHAEDFFARSPLTVNRPVVAGL
jgi:hypothetical protein